MNSDEINDEYLKQNPDAFEYSKNNMNDKKKLSQREIWLLSALVVVLAGAVWYWQVYSEGGDVIKTGDEMATTTPDEKTSPNQTKTFPPSTSSGTNSSLPTITKDGVYLVYYTNSGFLPSSLQISQKSTVRFVNNSSKAMRIFAEDRNDSKYYSLDQPMSVSKGSAYDYVFTNTGIWFYYNKNNSGDRGSITVY